MIATVFKLSYKFSNYFVARRKSMRSISQNSVSKEVKRLGHLQQDSVSPQRISQL